MSKQQEDRLKTVLENPIYNKLPNRKRKVKVDERFSGVLTDPKFTQKRYVDKRGRKVIENDGEHLKMMYEVDEPTTATRTPVKSRTTTTNIRGEKINSESSELDSDENDDDTYSLMVDSDEIDTENDVINKFKESSQNTIKLTTNITNRLAVCNMDWDRIDANDIYMIFQSFLPENGHIINVNVYISEYGKEKLNKEHQQGPEDLMQALDKTQQQSTEQPSSLEHFNEAYREYQLQRMKYYYAIIEFDSKDTAEHIYNECDDMDYEHSAISLDVRFVPDEISLFEPLDIKSTCSSLDDNYKPLDFYMDALQQTKLKVTWDEPDPKRMLLTSRARQYTPEDIMANSGDLDNLIASPSSSHDEDDDLKFDENERSEKYKTLLESDISSNDEITNEMEDEDSSDGEEVDLSEYQMPEHIKKSFQHDPVLSVKPFHSNPKIKKNPQQPLNSDNDNKRDITPIIVNYKNSDRDDDDTKKTLPGLFELMKKHKVSKSKAKKIIKQRKLNKIEEHFEVDTIDSRFGSLFKSAEFAVDPSHQRFRDSKAMNAVLDKQTSQRSFIRTRENYTATKRDGDQHESKEKQSDQSLNNLMEAVKKIKPKSMGAGFRKR